MSSRIRRSVVASMLLLGTILAGVAWRFAATHHRSITTVRVLKLKPSTSVPALVPVIVYTVQFPDGRSHQFADTEPFGSLNEVFIDSAGRNGTHVLRMRNDPGAMFIDGIGPNQAIQLIDDRDFLIVKEVVAQKLDVDKLPWTALGDEPQMQQNTKLGTIEVPDIELLAR